MTNHQRNGKSQQSAYGRLSRDLIVSEAVALADDDGMEGVSMPVLARRVGASPMALYRYVENKDDLIRAMVETVVAEVELVEDGDGDSAIREMAESLYAALMRHPWAGAILMTKYSWPATTPFSSRIAQHLEQCGLSVATRSHVAQGLYQHVCVQAMRDAVVQPAIVAELGFKQIRSQLVADGLDAYVAIIDYIRSEPDAPETELRFIIDALLAHAHQLSKDG